MRKRTIAVGTCIFLSFIISSSSRLLAQRSSSAALYNADVRGFNAYHKLRPIPLLQITLQTVNGKPMDASQVKAYQNPGY